MEELIPTRQSLLSRLKDWDDQDSWKAFFDTYWKLIYGAAMQAGLTNAEAQDVVQETVISVMKSMPTFQYRKEKGSFKSWLLNLTGWRIKDQLRRRDPDFIKEMPSTPEGLEELEEVEDPAGLGVEVWDQAWKSNLMEAAVERVKEQVDPKQFQVFDLYVLRQWPIADVMRAMLVSSTNIYVIKHRINRLIKKEVRKLEADPFPSNPAKR